MIMPPPPVLKRGAAGLPCQKENRPARFEKQRVAVQTKKHEPVHNFHATLQLIQTDF